MKVWHAGGWGPRGPSRHSSTRACFLQGLWSEGKGGAAQELLHTSSCCMLALEVGARHLHAVCVHVCACVRGYNVCVCCVCARACV